MKRTSSVFVGLDVHKDSIAVCWLEGSSQAEETREIPNEPKYIRRLFKKLESEGELRACYEAGSCGYEVRRQLEGMGIACEVIAPSLIPRRPGEHVKTDKRDARKLARLYRAGELTPIRVPSEKDEAIRDLLRCREDLVEDRTRQRHRLLKFLLRHGRIWRETRNGSQTHWEWIRSQRFDDPRAQQTFEEYLYQLDFTVERVRQLEAKIVEFAKEEPWRPLVARLRCLRGIETITALTLLAEIHDFRRFKSPRELMSFVGVTPGIHASGASERRGPITKAGNTHVRRVLIEAAWQYRHRPCFSGSLRERCQDQPEWVLEVARRAQSRLHHRYKRLHTRGKPAQVAVVAVARELLGFIWALLAKEEDKPQASGAPRRKEAG